MMASSCWHTPWKTLVKQIVVKMNKQFCWRKCSHVVNVYLGGQKKKKINKVHFCYCCASVSVNHQWTWDCLTCVPRAATLQTRVTWLIKLVELSHPVYFFFSFFFFFSRNFYYLISIAMFFCFVLFIFLVLFILFLFFKLNITTTFFFLFIARIFGSYSMWHFLFSC